MSSFYSEKEKEDMMGDLYNVGKSKMLGYLPLTTVKELLEQNLDNLKKTLIDRGLFVHIFEHNECNIAGGAIYVADLKQLQEFLFVPEQKNILDIMQWPSDAKLFINKVANEHAEYEPLYDLIAMTFNNPLLTTEQRLYAYPKQAQNVLAQDAPISKFNTDKISNIRENFNRDSNSYNGSKIK